MREFMPKIQWLGLVFLVATLNNQLTVSFLQSSKNNYIIAVSGSLLLPIFMVMKNQ